MTQMKWQPHSEKLLCGACKAERRRSQDGDAAAQLHLRSGCSLRASQRVRKLVPVSQGTQKLVL